MASGYSPSVAVYVIVRNPAGEILLHQRANTGFLDGYWDFPSGHVEPGEGIRQAAVRELAEEAGLQADVADLHLVHVNQNELDMPYMGFTFLASKWQGEPTIMEPEKCSGMAFFAPDALPAKCSLSVRQNAGDGFSSNLNYTLVNLQNYVEVMGEPYSH